MAVILEGGRATKATGGVSQTSLEEPSPGGKSPRAGASDPLDDRRSHRIYKGVRLHLGKTKEGSGEAPIK
jgi:hypothetical protein